MARAVHLRNAVALAGRFPVLAGVDLDVQAGELIALRGPNGAGKTSLLRACAGLLELTRGEASVLGVDLRTSRREVRHRVGLLLPGGGLYDDLSPAENLSFVARAARRPRASVGEAMEHLGVSGRWSSMPLSRCSTGQRRRTELAAMVVRAPELWLLDEPHSGLDSEARDLLDHLLTAVIAEGAAVMVVSHESDRLESLPARHLRMSGGKILREGLALAERPVHVA